MSEINDGGPAFPSKASADVVAQAKGLGYHVSDNKGMTLRDYFAAKAMQGLMGRNWDVDKLGDDVVAQQWVESAYQLADLMLTERIK